MTYRSLTYFFIVPFLAILGTAACSDDPDDPFSGAAADQSAGSPRNVNGPTVIGVDEEGNVILAGGTAMAGGGGGGMGMGGGDMGGAGGMGMGGSDLGAGGGAIGQISEDMNGGGGVSCDVVAEVFEVSCNGGGCHDGSAPGNFGTSEAAALALVDQPTSIAACGNFIDTVNPEDSALLTKLDDPPCGLNRMPLGRPDLSASQLSCLQEWIESL